LLELPAFVRAKIHTSLDCAAGAYGWRRGMKAGEEQLSRR